MVVIASEGDNITLDCLTDAHDSNTIYLWLYRISDLVCTDSDCSDGNVVFEATDAGKQHWFYNTIKNSSVLLFSELMNATVGRSRMLTLQNVNASVGGEYVCVAMNDAGIGSATSNVFVKPYITQEPVDVEVDYFDQVALSCEAEGFPEVTLQWRKQEGNGNPFSDVPGENSTMFVLPNALLEDNGIYRCIATNTINGTEFTANSSDARCCW